MNRHITNAVLGETVTFVETRKESGGRRSRLLMTLEPGGGTPLHYHTSYNETFTALEGRLGLEFARRRRVFLEPGESHTVAIGEVHRLFNGDAERIRFLNKVSHGHTGFENTLRREQLEPKGEPNNPLTDLELRDKFTGLVSLVRTRGNPAEEVASALMALEDRPEVASVIRQLDASDEVPALQEA